MGATAAARCTSTATSALSSSRVPYTRRPATTAAAAAAEVAGSSSTPALPHPSTHCHRPPASTRSTITASRRRTPAASSASPNIVAMSPKRSAHISHEPLSVDTNTATAPSAPLRPTNRANRSSAFAAATSLRSARRTQLTQPPCTAATTNDSTGRNPSIPGRFRTTSPIDLVEYILRSPFGNSGPAPMTCPYITDLTGEHRQQMASRIHHQMAAMPPAAAAAAVEEMQRGLTRITEVL